MVGLEVDGLTHFYMSLVASLKFCVNDSVSSNFCQIMPSTINLSSKEVSKKVASIV
jgi:hypothetical protein